MIKVAIDISEFDATFKTMTDRLQARFVSIAAPILIGQVLLLTAAGLDFEGRRFKKYSKSYARKRAKAGLVTSRVNLVYKGEMIPSVDLRGQLITVSDDQQDKALGHNEGSRRLPVRRFLDASQKTADMVADAIALDLNK